MRSFIFLFEKLTAPFTAVNQYYNLELDIYQKYCIFRFYKKNKTETTQ
jgi:hypothetical protein